MRARRTCRSRRRRERYYKSGKPFLQRYLPYWAANFVDRMLILLIPIFAVLIPAIKFVPILYTYRLKARIVRGYAQLGVVESELSGRPDRSALGDYLARLDAIEAEIAATRLPKWMGEQTYLLRAAIELVRERLRLAQAKANPELRDRVARWRGPWNAHPPGVAAARGMWRPRIADPRYRFRGATPISHARSGATF